VINKRNEKEVELEILYLNFLETFQVNTQVKYDSIKKNGLYSSSASDSKFIYIHNKNQGLCKIGMFSSEL
jgi:hypothetical protein